jgi:hypothetical protein
MAAIYSNGGNSWNILGFNFTKRDALSSLYRACLYGSRLARQPGKRDEFLLCLYDKMSSRLPGQFCYIVLF